MSFHRNVSLLILFDDKKKILLQHRSEDNIRFPGFWGFFGGGIDDNETSEEALIREIKEEIGYTPNDYELVYKQDLSKNKSAEGLKGTKFIYIEKHKSKNIYKIIDKESQGMGWFKIDETKKLKMLNHDREVLKKIQTIINNS